MNKCPHCGSEEYYARCSMSGQGVYRFRFDGKDADNGDLHDCLEYRTQKTAYCNNCHRKLGPRKQVAHAAQGGE